MQKLPVIRISRHQFPKLKSLTSFDIGEQLFRIDLQASKFNQTTLGLDMLKKRQ